MVENDAVLTNPVSVRAPHGFEVKLCRNLKLVSSGGGAAAWMGYHVGPVLPGLAPHIESLVVHMVHDEQESANLNHRLSIQFSADGFNWDGTAIVLSSSSSLGYRIGSDYSTETSFGRFIRFSLELEDDGTPYQGKFSAWVMIKLRC